MDVTIDTRGAVAVVSVAGSIDAMTSPQLTEALEGQLQAGTVNIVADLGEVDYTSSAGLRSMLASLKESRRQGGDFRLAAIQPGVFRVLEMSGFTSILKHYDTVAEAVDSFGS
ncbi:MAG TPA: STAS domain-containing protein [Methylomirabilota bacterium]|nr:STAS domain-containing protein [Methylomirabilota bacterium]